jgi:N-dimethylarginine dimethylaminohydrolase
MPTRAPRHVFLIPPTHFGIEHIVNDWMDPEVKADPDLAQSQWEELIKTYRELGANVEILESHPGLPDQVFPGDAIFLYGDQAIASRFKVEQRAAEVQPMIERFEARGYTVHQLPEGMHFEGNAEAIQWNGSVLAGYGVRSDAEALDQVGELLGLNIVPLKIKPPYFHLDITVCPLSDDILAYVPSAFDPESRERLERLGAEMIAIDDQEAMKLACNSMSVNGTVILSTPEVERFPRALEKAGFDVKSLDLREFAKSGGGAKCLTLEAYS